MGMGMRTELHVCPMVDGAATIGLTIDAIKRARVLTLRKISLDEAVRKSWPPG